LETLSSLQAVVEVGAVSSEEQLPPLLPEPEVELAPSVVEVDEALSVELLPPFPLKI